MSTRSEAGDIELSKIFPITKTGGHVPRGHLVGSLACPMMILSPLFRIVPNIFARVSWPTIGPVNPRHVSPLENCFVSRLSWLVIQPCGCWKKKEKILKKGFKVYTLLAKRRKTWSIDHEQSFRCDFDFYYFEHREWVSTLNLNKGRDWFGNTLVQGYRRKVII